MPRRLIVLFVLSLALSATRAAAQGMPLTGCKTDPNATFGTGSKWDGTAGRLVGPVKFVCDDTTVFADEITWDEKIMRASGSVLVVQEGLRVTAERAEMDRVTRLGTFYKAAGTARLTDRDIKPSMFGTLEPEVSFYAEKIEKLAPRKYRLTDGWFSTCLQANPRWDMRGSSGTITLDEYVLLKNAVLRVKGVPVIYLPMLYYPLSEDDRSTGFLLPTYTASSVRGQGISNAFFWAISRSMDATFYHDYASKSGTGAAGEYRFISGLGSWGNVKVSTIDENERLAEDGTVERAARRTYEVIGSMNQPLTRHFRAIVSTRYFTDVSTLQLYQQNTYEASQRMRYFSGTVTGNIGRYRLAGMIEKRDFFTDPTTAQRTGRTPQLTLNMGNKPIGRTKITFGANAQLSGIQNQLNASDPSTNKGLWRFDASPTISAPLSKLAFLSANVSGSWRITHWTDSLDPVTGLRESVSITRPLTEVRADVVGPVVEKVFQTPDNGFADKFKHVIEPRVSVAWLSPFEHVNNVINNDYSVDCLVGGNTTVSYALFNRIKAKRREGAGAGQAREIFSTGISQSYYTVAAASACDTQYQVQAPGQFSSVKINATTAPTDSVSARFDMYLDSKTLQTQSYGASVTALGSRGQVTAIWSKRQFLPDVPGYNNPAAAAHALSAWTSAHTPSGKWIGNFSFQADLKRKTLLDWRTSVSYAAQCCGVSVDYQVVNVAPYGVGIQTDHRFNFSFTLAGIGTFSNPLGSFGR
jgi:LPS-assembly protein